MKKFRVLYFGTWGYGAAGLKGLLKCSNVEIVKVYTKWNLEIENEYMNQVFKLTTKFNLDVFNSARELCSYRQFENDVLKNTDIDFVISCCFDRIFKKNILELPKILALNIHPSILPKYRGVKPLENAIVKNEKKTGITFHQLVEKLDAGDILLQDNSIEIKDDDTYGELYEKQCNQIELNIIKFFKDPFRYIQNKLPQDDSIVSFAPRINMKFNDKDKVWYLKKKFQEIYG